MHARRRRTTTAHLGGTLINESISASAGAAHGQLVRPAELRRVIRDAGRMPAQRDTLYRILRSYAASPSTDEHDPLAEIRDGDARFGSYGALTHDGYRFKDRATRSV